MKKNKVQQEMSLDFPGQHQNRQPGLESKMHPEPIFISSTYTGAAKLKGKVALITGGDSGIGRAICVHFAREGAAAIGLMYHPSEEEDAQRTKTLIEAEGSTCLLLPGDLRDIAYMTQAVQKTLDTFKRIHILVNNAAHHVEQNDFTNITDQQLEDTFAINILSMFRLTKLVVPHLKKDDCIINTTSVVSYRGSDNLIDYAATKGAVTAFTRSLSQNLVDRGIRVNGVAPGPIYTPLVVSTKPAKVIAEFGQDTPSGRAGQPAELAPAFVYLASDSASYITGQVIHVNGGSVVNG